MVRKDIATSGPARRTQPRSRSGGGEALPSAESQSERFKETAVQLGADDDEDAFNERLRRLAKQKPKDDGKSKD